MKNETGKFKFRIPEDSKHADAGKTLDNQTFDYEVCENEAEALQVIEKRGWNILDIVNEKVKTGSRASAYQNLLALYKPSEVSAEDIRERMIRDFIRLGNATGNTVTEQDAAQAVDMVLASKRG